jgi:hypothetical protein
MPPTPPSQPLPPPPTRSRPDGGRRRVRVVTTYDEAAAEGSTQPPDWFVAGLATAADYQHRRRQQRSLITGSTDDRLVADPLLAYGPKVCRVHLRGRLGNRLFQLAAAQAHCWRTGHSLVIGGEGLPFGTTLLPRVAASLAATATALETTAAKATATTGTVDWSEPSFAYTPIPSGARSLYGYFQSSRHFAEVAGAVREWFSPDAAFVCRVNERYPPWPVECSVAVHVRRTDYVQTAAVAACHSVVTPAYYERALRELRTLVPGARFYVFSDDLDWCRTQSALTATDCHLVAVPDTAEAFQVLTRFRHYVLANSSFSWWAAYLGEPSQHVIAPQRWFGRNFIRDFHDVFESHWLLRPPGDVAESAVPRQRR